MFRSKTFARPPRRSAISLLMILLLAGCGCKSTPPLTAAPIVSAPPNVKNVLVQDMNPDDLIISQDHVVATISYKGYERNIYGSKSFFSSNAHAPFVKTNFVGQTFYVDPLLIINTDELQNAFKNRKPLSPNGTEQNFQMAFYVHLLDDAQYRVAVATRLNQQTPGVMVKAEDITIIPYRAIQIYLAESDSGFSKRTSLGMYPPVIADDFKNGIFPDIGTRPAAPEVRVQGTELFLKTVADNPQRISADFWISGFTVKQNILNLSLASLVSQGYYRYLNGQADWQHFEDSSYNSSAGSMALGPVSQGDNSTDQRFRMTNKCWVTRNQIRTCVQKSEMNIKDILWIEIRDKADVFNAEREKLVDYLCEQAKSREATIVKLEDKWRIQDSQIEADLGPDRISKINSTINDQTTLKNHENTNATGYGSDDRQDDYISNSDIKWGTEGNMIIPKSIELFEIQNSTFSDVASFSSTYIEATPGQQNKRYQGVTREWSETVSVQPPNQNALLFLNHFGWTWYRVDKARSDALAQHNANLVGPHFRDNNQGYIASCCDPIDLSQYAKVDNLPWTNTFIHGTNREKDNEKRNHCCIYDKTIHDQPANHGLPIVLPQWAEIMDDEVWAECVLEFKPVKQNVLRDVGP